jgi:hypothetical protein
MPPGRFLVSALFVACGVVGFARAKQQKEHPLRGQVVSVGTELTVHGVPVYTDPYGKTHGGVVKTRHYYIYTVRTDKLEYDVAGSRRLDPVLAVGQTITFRVSKSSLFVLAGEKEKKYSIVGERDKTVRNR